MGVSFFGTPKKGWLPNGFLLIPTKRGALKKHDRRKWPTTEASKRPKSGNQNQETAVMDLFLLISGLIFSAHLRAWLTLSLHGSH